MKDGPSPDTTAAVHHSLERLAVPLAGTQVQGWVLGERLGEGGSSVVVAATRTAADGFTQEAALKLLRTGAGHESFVRYFQRERQILVGLVHPHIVRLLDGGSTDAGLPWYAMERIQAGIPLTDWCAGRPLAARLRVLIQVCRAADHAHQRLVVHCDLKPANVLVDPDGAPHILDFGIARLLDEGEQTRTSRLLTPRWAAPEQLAGDDVTVATDVYALGLLLWAILTGEAPRAGLTGAALLGASQAPLPPPSRQHPACRGDLDAIVLRATAPEPGDRYHSARALAEDLERHLAGDAVQARAGLVGYQVARWLRRHRLAAAGGLLLAVLLVGWAITATLQAQRISAERDRAGATLALLVDLLEAADPAVARGESLTVQEVLQAARRELEVQPPAPRLSGELLLVIGRVQLAVGVLPEARETLEQAVGLLEQVYPPDHPQVLRATLALAFAEANLSGHALAHIERAESIAIQLQDPQDRAWGLRLLADLRAVRGDLEQAEQHALAAIAAHTALGDARGAAQSRALLGFIHAYQGRGTDTLRAALRETEAALGTRMHPDVADILHELAQLTPAPEGLRLAEESLTLRRALYGEGWVLASTLNNYGLGLEESAPEQAVHMLREAHRMASAARGPDHPDTLYIQVNEGAVMIDTGHAEEGMRLLRAAADHTALAVEERARALYHIARVEVRDGHPDAAGAALRAGLALLPAEDTETRPRLQEALDRLALSAE